MDGRIQKKGVGASIPCEVDEAYEAIRIECADVRETSSEHGVEVTALVTGPSPREQGVELFPTYGSIRHQSEVLHASSGVPLSYRPPGLPLLGRYFAVQGPTTAERVQATVRSSP